MDYFYLKKKQYVYLLICPLKSLLTYFITFLVLEWKLIDARSPTFQAVNFTLLQQNKVPATSEKMTKKINDMG